MTKTTSGVTDTAGGQCYRCKGTRHEYRCYGRVARRRCCGLGCHVVVSIDVTATMQRTSKTWNVEQWRAWWAGFYGA